MFANDVYGDCVIAGRAAGWTVGRRTYAIQAFAEVNRASRDEVRQAIYADVGVGLGLLLPASAQQQIQTGRCAPPGAASSR